MILNRLLIASVMLVLSSVNALAFDLNELLKKAGESINAENISDMLEGVVSKSNISVADLCGIWQSTGSAVSFRSENFLDKAGGIAAATAIESKLDPYFSKYGLTGAILTINPDSTFSLKIKSITLKGRIDKQNTEGFIFSFNSLGKTKIGNIPAYISKTSQKMDLMFDAAKLKSLVSTIASFSGLQLAKTASDLLNRYEGLCVGFELRKTGNSPQSNNSQSKQDNSKKTTTQSSSKKQENTKSQKSNSSINDLLQRLKGESK